MNNFELNQRQSTPFSDWKIPKENAEKNWLKKTDREKSTKTTVEFQDLSLSPSLETQKCWITIPI